MKGTSPHRQWGRPTDDWRQGLQEFKQYKWGKVIACAAGDDADVSVLRQIADDVVRLNDNDVNVLHYTLHHYYCPVS